MLPDPDHIQSAAFSRKQSQYQKDNLPTRDDIYTACIEHICEAIDRSIHDGRFSCNVESVPGHDFSQSFYIRSFDQRAPFPAEDKRFVKDKILRHLKKAGYKVKTERGYSTITISWNE